MTAPSSPRGRNPFGIVVVLGVTLLLLVGLFSRRAPDAPAPEEAAETTRNEAESPAALAMALELFRLRPDGKLAGWTVDSVFIPRPIEGDLGVRFVRGNYDTTVYVAHKGTRTFQPPVSTERYDLFYSHTRAPPPTDPEPLVSTLLGAVEGRIRKNEAAAKPLTKNTARP